MQFIAIISAFILREMTTSHGRKSGGYIWAIAEPAAGIFLLSIAFSLIFRSPPLGDNFPLFYATGVLSFGMYTSTSQKISKTFQSSKSLLAYPMVSIFDAAIAKFMLNLLTQLIISVIILVGIITYFSLDLIISYQKIFVSVAMAFSLGFGIGTLNCFLFVRFPSWSSVWSILHKPMFLISGILFLFESVPKELQYYLWFNPVIHITAEMRSAFYANYDAQFVTPHYVFGISCLMMFIGIVLLARYEKEFVSI